MKETARLVALALILCAPALALADDVGLAGCQSGDAECAAAEKEFIANYCGNVANPRFPAAPVVTGVAAAGPVFAVTFEDRSGRPDAAYYSFLFSPFRRGSGGHGEVPRGGTQFRSALAPGFYTLMAYGAFDERPATAFHGVKDKTTSNDLIILCRADDNPACWNPCSVPSS